MRKATESATRTKITRSARKSMEEMGFLPKPEAEVVIWYKTMVYL